MKISNNKISEKETFIVYEALLNRREFPLRTLVLCKLISLEKESCDVVDISKLAGVFCLPIKSIKETLKNLEDDCLIRISNGEITLNKYNINEYAGCKIFPGVEPEKVNDYEEFEKQLIICDRMVQTPEFYCYLNRKNKKLAEYFFEELRKGEKKSDDF